MRDFCFVWPRLTTRIAPYFDRRRQWLYRRGAFFAAPRAGRYRYLDIADGRARRITWDDLAADGLPECDVVVNLAGQHILDIRRRWNDAYREEVIQSRVETTKTLVDAINKSTSPPEVFVSTAGKCFYGTRESDGAEAHPELDEDSEPMGMDFPAELVSLWEAAAEGVDSARVRHIKLRIGVVLGKVERKFHIGRLWRSAARGGFSPSSGSRSALASAPRWAPAGKCFHGSISTTW